MLLLDHCGTSITGMSSAITASQSMRPAVRGGARLRYELVPDFGTRVMGQWVRPPLHMAKAYHDKAWAVSLLMSPTAGLLDGDFLELDVQVCDGAYAGLISPAACRIHTMNTGYATVQQKFVVGEDAVLDVWPAPLILQKAANLQQTTRLEVAESSTVLLCEVVTPGRAAYGESFEFTRWASSLRIVRAGKLVAYENFELFPDQGDAADWRSLYPNGSYAGIYYLTPQPLGDLVQALHQLELEDVSIGASPLRAGGLGIKVLAQDGISLRKAIFSVRNLLVPHSQIVFPSALRRAQTFFG